MTVNANYIYSYLLSAGWSKNAICATLGNMQQESTINPGIVNSIGATGLVQWYPGTKLTYWCSSMGYNWRSIDSQLKRILYEVESNLQWIATDSFPLSFAEYTVSNQSLAYLVEAFCKNYERTDVELLEKRISYAEYWYEHVSGSVISFEPRLNDEGIQGSIYYYNENPFFLSGYGMPNCTCYAWGRFWEISDTSKSGSNRPTLPTSDAGLWISQVGTEYETGYTARLGAVICWSDNSGGAGHVAIVEEINADGSIVTSNSAYNSTYFYTKTIPSDYSLSGYTFQGFIYNPFIFVPPDGPEETSKKKKGFNFVLFHHRRRRFIYG